MSGEELRRAFNGDDPNELAEIRRDLDWARLQRKRCETVHGKLIVWGVMAAAGFLAAMTGAGMVEFVKRKLGL